MLCLDLKGPGRRGRVLARLVALALLAAPLGGCESLSDLFGAKAEIPDSPPEKLYNEGLFLLNTKKDYKNAARRFEEVERQHPYSDWARKALLMTAYTYYEMGDYDESISSARRYVTLHPGSQDAAYAQFLIGSSYFDRINDVTRDQERADRAITAMEEIIRKYPDSEYALDAKKKIEVAKDQLAGKEMLVGRYYMERKNFIGAINRFKVIVTKYQTTRHVEEALLRLTEAYMSLGIVDEAQTSAAVLGHNFPDSRWYQDAFALVQQRGLQPNENKSSWISQAFRNIRPS